MLLYTMDNSCHFGSICRLCVDLMHVSTYTAKNYYYSYFMDKETEPQRV